MNRLCGNCGRPRRTEAGCACIPSWLWELPEVRRAVEAKDADALIRLVRRHTNLSQHALARMAGVSQPMVSNIISHKSGLKNIDRIDQALEGLGATQAGTRSFVEIRSSRLSTPAHSSLPVGLDLLPPPITLIATRGSSRIAIDDLLTALVALDDRSGGGNIYPPLRTYLEDLTEAVEHHDRGIPALGTLSQMVGWIAMDAGHQGAARTHLTTAVYAGHETDDVNLAASALSYRSLQETYLGRHRQALALAKTAVDIGAGASPAVATMLQARLARAQAKAADQHGVERSIDRMREAFDHMRRDGEIPVWLSYVDETEIEAQAGAAYLDLGKTDQALNSLTHALDLLRLHAPHRVRDQTHYLVRMSRAHLAHGDAHQACEIAEQALDLAGRIRSPRVDDRIVELRTQFLPWIRDEKVQAFLHRSRVLMPAPPQS